MLMSQRADILNLVILVRQLSSLSDLMFKPSLCEGQLIRGKKEVALKAEQLKELDLDGG